MYWANRKSEFYGTRLNSLGPIALRLATAGLSSLDFIMETTYGRHTFST